MTKLEMMKMQAECEMNMGKDLAHDILKSLYRDIEISLENDNVQDDMLSKFIYTYNNAVTQYKSGKAKVEILQILEKNNS